MSTTIPETKPEFPEKTIKRILYINNISPQFYVGDPDKYQINKSKARTSLLKKAVEIDFDHLISIIEEANANEQLPRRSIIFLILGLLMNHENMTPELKNKTRNFVLRLIQSEDDFFNFVKYYTENREEKQCKLPSSVEKLIRKYYTDLTPAQLLQSFIKCKSHHGWSHKDLIKLSHFKSDSQLKNGVVNYILKETVNDELKKDEELYKLVQDHQQFKENGVRPYGVISTSICTVKSIQTSSKNKKEIWAQYATRMTIKEVLHNLCKLYNLKLLKASSETTDYIVNLFKKTNVLASGIHPMQLFISMKKLQKGGKPLDPKLIEHLTNDLQITPSKLRDITTRDKIRCARISKLLEDTFDIACENIQPTNKRFLITIDVTEKAKAALCVGNKAVTFLQASVAYARMLLKVEKNVSLAIFVENHIVIIDVDKKISYRQLLECFKSKSSKYSNLVSPWQWAITNKKQIDVFINFIHNDYQKSLPKVLLKNGDSFKNYMKIMGNSRMITFGLTSRKLPRLADNESIDHLLIFGFDVPGCRAAEAYYRREFS